MRKAAVVILWATLLAASAGAQQVCLSGIPQTTPTADFAVRGDGTLTHKRTGLMWKQCVEGLSGTDCATGTASTHTWQQALELADGHNFAGYGDWRLPNIKELASIVDWTCYSPAINLSVFPNDPGSYPDFFVWSGTPDAPSLEDPDEDADTWSLGFHNGWNRTDYRGDGLGVRLVRGGQ